MPDPRIPAAQVSELLHGSLHEIGGANGRIHRIAALLERNGGGLAEDLRSWLGHLGTATAQLDVSLQAVRRYAEALDLPHQTSRFPLTHVLHRASAPLRVEPRIKADELPEVEADAARVELVFRELLDNAVKFRAGESCEIEVSAVEENGLVISVADNGMGIDPRQAERIFRPFARLHGDRFPGAGMGLAIARTIVEGWNGRLWFEPRPSGGSVFRFTLLGGLKPAAG